MAHAQAAVVIAVLALGLAVRARLLALLRLLTRGGSVMRNLLARSLCLHPIRTAPCMRSPCLCSRAGAALPLCQLYMQSITGVQRVNRRDCLHAESFCGAALVCRGSEGGPEQSGSLLQVTLQAAAQDGAQRACDALLDNVTGRSVFLVDFHVWKVPDR